MQSFDGGTGAMNDLLQSNVTTGWERTAGGNWIRIHNGKIRPRLRLQSCVWHAKKDRTGRELGRKPDR